jgi:phosphoadenosine phosphosulfate reductase
MTRHRCATPHVPLPVFLAGREAVLANPHPLGLLVSPGRRVEACGRGPSRFASVAIAFPGFTDGRGYSSARLVVERYGYRGEVRAVGDVLADQIPLMRRCGINAFVVRHEPTRKALIERQTCDRGYLLSTGRQHRGPPRHAAVPPPRGGDA